MSTPATMSVTDRIKLNQFKFRDYQIPIVDAIENKDVKRALIILPRRAGKDIACFQIAIRQALRKVCTIYYVFPTFSGARRALWDCISIDGQRLLDYIPEGLAKKNSSEMKITFINNSIIQLLGSDHYDRLRGTNPYMVIFSEYAYQDPRAWTTVRPILAANDGIACFVSTPFGKNHFWDMYQLASSSKDWFCYKLDVDETRHISETALEKEKQEMSEDMYEQEFFCSFTAGVEGSYYSKYINKMRLNNQITNVPWEVNHPVHTAWDIGVRDSTSIIFFQTIGQTVHIIDCYEKNKEGLEHYISVLESKPYKYGKHFGPHDIAVKEWTSGVTRIEKAKQLGVTFTIAPNVSIMDGIEAVRSSFCKIWIDEEKCKPLLKALDAYRQEYDSVKKIYKNQPLHDFASHFADCFRYLAVSLPKTKDSLSSEDLDANYRRAMYGEESSLPDIFRKY
jgi:hypothetical protein